MHPTIATIVVAELARDRRDTAARRRTVRRRRGLVARRARRAA